MYLIIITLKNKPQDLEKAYTGDGYLINSEFLNGLTVELAKEKIIKEIEKLRIGQKKYHID